MKRNSLQDYMNQPDYQYRFVIPDPRDGLKPYQRGGLDYDQHQKLKQQQQQEFQQKFPRGPTAKINYDPQIFIKYPKFDEQRGIFDMTGSGPYNLKWTDEEVQRYRYDITEAEAEREKLQLQQEQHNNLIQRQLQTAAQLKQFQKEFQEISDDQLEFNFRENEFTYNQQQEQKIDFDAGVKKRLLDPDYGKKKRSDYHEGFMQDEHYPVTKQMLDVHYRDKNPKLPDYQKYKKTKKFLEEFDQKQMKLRQEQEDQFQERIKVHQQQVREQLERQERAKGAPPGKPYMINEMLLTTWTDSNKRDWVREPTDDDDNKFEIPQDSEREGQEILTQEREGLRPESGPAAKGRERARQKRGTLPRYRQPFRKTRKYITYNGQTYYITRHGQWIRQ